MRVDWNDKQSVVNYARQLHCSTPLVVFKHSDRSNFNIVHESRKDLYRPEWVVCRVLPQFIYNLVYYFNREYKGKLDE